jgi:hypothetical protein
LVSPTFVLLGLLLPALVAGAALYLGRGSRRLGALGFGLGLLIGYPAVTGSLPQMPPQDGTQMLFYVSIGLALAAWFEARPGGSLASRFPLRIAVTFLVPLLLMKNRIAHWEPTESFQHVTLAALALLALWSGADALAERRKGATLPLVLWLAVTGASLALLASRFAINSQLCGVVASMLGAAVVAAWLRPELSLARGPIAVPAMLLGALCLGGVYLHELPPLSGLLLVLAPLAAWLGELGPLARLPARRALIVRLALVLIPVAIAYYLAQPEPSPYDDYD